MSDPARPCYVVVIGDDRDGHDIDDILGAFTDRARALAAAGAARDALRRVGPFAARPWAWDEQYAEWTDGWHFVGVREVPLDGPA
jgi:hypothetical protein